LRVRRARFDSAADLYDATRPSYPEELTDDLVDQPDEPKLPSKLSSRPARRPTRVEPSTCLDFVAMQFLLAVGKRQLNVQHLSDGYRVELIER
jgi:hypothetical protein